MKKTYGLFIVIICISLSGCRPTPEIPPVVNRSKGGIRIRSLSLKKKAN